MNPMRRNGMTRDLAAVAMGRKPADLILKNARLVDVCTARIRRGCDVAVCQGHIALVGDAGHVQTDGRTRIIDLEGRYLAPGLIDSHMHVESSMVDLPAFAAGVLPHGTTTICPDIHEMTNVLGMDALRLFRDSAKTLPLKVLTAMPVCVPSLPGMEDGGAVIRPDDVASAYAEGLAFLQGEQMNFPGVIFGDEDVHAITVHGLNAAKVMTGHYADRDLNGGLSAYIASGMMADHETTTPEGALARAGLGMYVQQRYGSAWLDLPHLMEAILENPGMDTRMFTLVTDDVTPATIASEGHLIRVVRKAVSLGLNPITALQMATLNAAQLLRQDQWIGSVTPGRAADLLVLDSLQEMAVSQVFCDGRMVARNQALTVEIPAFDYPDWAVNTLYLAPLTPRDFQIDSPSQERVCARVIRLVPGQVHTLGEESQLAVRQGQIHASPDQDLAKAAMVYRHKAEIPEANRRALGLVAGTGFMGGTAFASTVGHDCHNLMVIGMDDRAMALAANAVIASNGGMAVVADQTVLAHLPLPLMGIMSLTSVEKTAVGLAAVEAALAKIGCPHPAFEMTMSLLGLVVLGELRLSNRGLVELKDGAAPRFVPLFV